jgi:hypothetical protein
MKTRLSFLPYNSHSSKEGKLQSMTGDYYSLDNVKTTPTLTRDQAFDLALKQVELKNIFGIHLKTHNK